MLLLLLHPFQSCGFVDPLLRQSQAGTKPQGITGGSQLERAQSGLRAGLDSLLELGVPWEAIPVQLRSLGSHCP